MPRYLSNELANTATGLTQPTQADLSIRPFAGVYAGRLKRLRATITLAAQTTADDFVVGSLPSGAAFAFGVINSTVTLGTSTIAVGVTGATGRYRAAATFTTADTPTLFGPASQAAAAPLTAETQVLATPAVATLPGSGTLVIDIYYSYPN